MGSEKGFLDNTKYIFFLRLIDLKCRKLKDYTIEEDLPNKIM